MRHVALLGLALCVVSLLLSAQAADGSVGEYLDRGLKLIEELNHPAGDNGSLPPHHPAE